MTARLAVARQDPQLAASAGNSARQLTEAADIRSDVFVRAEIMAALGEALCAQKSSEEGSNAAAEALTTRSAILRTGSPYLAESQIDLARCLLNAGQTEQAKPLLASARQLVSAQPLGPQFESSLQSVQSRIP